MIGCEKSPIVNSEIELKEGIWSFDDIVSIDFNIAMSDQRHNLILQIDHSIEYEFQNIYINIETTFPDGDTKSKTLPIDLAKKNGQWIGQCNSNNCNLEIVLLQQFIFKDLGDYKISITQHSREESLKNINRLNLGLFPVSD